MASYVYNCKGCGVFKEVIRGIRELEVLPTCDTCGNFMKRIYSPVPVTFKGTGFYKTGG
jgi:putative FmdB family regulatory protein